MHDRKTDGSGKPVQNRPRAARPKPISGRSEVGRVSGFTSELGARPDASSREDARAALASVVPQRPQFFNFDAQAVRVAGSWDSPLFVARDVCEILDLAKPRDAILSLEDYEKGCPVLVDTLGGPQEMATVSEAGLYALIFRSRKPNARLFRRWVTTEVLPSIRKSGRYEAPRPLVIELTPPAPGGHGHFAMLELPSGRPAPDLATEHFSTLLHTTLGDSAGEWSGRLDDLIRVARANHLFWWILRDPADLCQRVAFGVMLRRRIGIVYAGYACTKLRLHALGRNRHRKYLITREGGALS